jgi:hypothetical protein
VVIPADNEGQAITDCRSRIVVAVGIPFEALVVHDRLCGHVDTTAASALAYASRDSRVQPLLNDLGSGRGAAIRCGIRAARAGVEAVTLAVGVVSALYALVSCGTAPRLRTVASLQEVI